MLHTKKLTKMGPSSVGKTAEVVLQRTCTSGTFAHHLQGGWRKLSIACTGPRDNGGQRDKYFALRLVAKATRPCLCFHSPKSTLDSIGVTAAPKLSAMPSHDHDPGSLQGPTSANTHEVPLGNIATTGVS